MAKSKKSRKGINNLVVVSDIHAGCRLGLYPVDDPITLDEGGPYQASRLQRVTWAWWQEFWGQWVPLFAHNEPFAVVVNGDAVDGVHHGSTTQISQNLADQEEIAYRILKPVVDACDGRFYLLRGTEAHGGKSGVDEERLAKRLGAVKDQDGRYARWSLWLRAGRGLCHFSHHISTASSMAYETSALRKELEQMYVNAAQTGQEPPDIVVRSHRHRRVDTSMDTYKGRAVAFVTDGWQLKTPFSHRIMGGRVTEPQIGGSVIRSGDHDVYARHQGWQLERPTVEVP